jgi:hypothetical protein
VELFDNTSNFDFLMGYPSHVFQYELHKTMSIYDLLQNMSSDLFLECNLFLLFLQAEIFKKIVVPVGNNRRQTGI